MHLVSCRHDEVTDEFVGLFPVLRRRKFTFTIDILNVLDGWNFCSIGFFIWLDTEVIHSQRIFFPFQEPTAGSRSASDWHIFSAAKRHHDAGFLAFHKVKCGSEHFQQNLLSLILAHPAKTACTIFAQFFVHSVTKLNPCAIVFSGEGFCATNV